MEGGQTDRGSSAVQILFIRIGGLMGNIMDAPDTDLLGLAHYAKSLGRPWVVDFHTCSKAYRVDQNHWYREKRYADHTAGALFPGRPWLKPGDIRVISTDDLIEEETCTT